MSMWPALNQVNVDWGFHKETGISMSECRVRGEELVGLQRGFLVRRLKINPVSVSRVGIVLLWGWGK